MARIQPVRTKNESELVDQFPLRLSPEELGPLAKKLMNAENPKAAARLRESITRGFYGSH
jgi:hypothetical protein